MKKVTVYTDGSCKKNPGPGGWAAILIYGSKEKEISGGDTLTTNNRMELTAAIEALSALREPCEVELWSDSKYLVDAVTLGWAEKWKKAGWKKPDKKEALNPDLWDKLLELNLRHTVSYRWLRGHDGHEYNERCDMLAQSEAEKRK